MKHYGLMNCKVPSSTEKDGVLYFDECQSGFYLSDQITLNSSGYSLQNKAVCCADT